MLNIIIDNLSRLEESQYIAVLQIGLILIWIFVTRKSKNGYKISLTGYKISLTISLFLLLVSMAVLALTLTSVAKVLSEYAFLFLGIGIIQILVSKDS